MGMTSEEAVEILEEVKTLDDSMFAYSRAYNDAMNMAIEALKAQEPEATFTEILNSVPTVNAIPVEWLNEMKRLAADYGDNECVNVIEYLFVRWQEEQEANDGQQ